MCHVCLTRKKPKRAILGDFGESSRCIQQTQQVAAPLVCCVHPHNVHAVHQSGKHSTPTKRSAPAGGFRVRQLHLLPKPLALHGFAHPLAPSRPAADVGVGSVVVEDG
eukprot:CAMPEP_0173384096 /NCGR_PEP_ID=MMETSP1356-20130122/6663_1 /TAXON_ID=77927 ORGANISM="Hemiselmis virescens, Strain PCC157" /NCGR_SAMPLE_ID=MMETSP1356 /ASSEMBLY_ACC=CAM_ASM_000847 /LENGTH=107 /DNA_ID=CAMNT_0014339275 /DNA_START=201 /DNA_END=521 /DNA_ORIENTATION=+